jgi:hypothetical protein
MNVLLRKVKTTLIFKFLKIENQKDKLLWRKSITTQHWFPSTNWFEIQPIFVSSKNSLARDKQK